MNKKINFNLFYLFILVVIIPMRAMEEPLVLPQKAYNDLEQYCRRLLAVRPAVQRRSKKEKRALRMSFQRADQLVRSSNSADFLWPTIQELRDEFKRDDALLPERKRLLGEVKMLQSTIQGYRRAYLAHFQDTDTIDQIRSKLSDHLARNLVYDKRSTYLFLSSIAHMVSLRGQFLNLCRDPLIDRDSTVIIRDNDTVALSVEQLSGYVVRLQGMRDMMPVLVKKMVTTHRSVEHMGDTLYAAEPYLCLKHKQSELVKKLTQCTSGFAVLRWGNDQLLPLAGEYPTQSIMIQFEQVRNLLQFVAEKTNDFSDQIVSTSYADLTEHDVKNLYKKQESLQHLTQRLEEKLQALRASITQPT